MSSRCLPSEERCLLAFRGPDAVRYLNGQLTQDTRNLADTALPACVTDAKGKLQAFVYVFRGNEDSIWIDAPSEQAEELETRLTRYLIADDVEVEDLTGQWKLIHVIDASQAPTVPDGALVRNASRAGCDGYDVWLPAGTSFETASLTGEEAETRRITTRTPAWGRELIPGMLPPEAGLDQNAISYHKGCYIGQEVLSRIKSSGRLNRKLAAFLVGPEAAIGDTFAGEKRSTGSLTSIAPQANEDGLFPALGFLDKSAFEKADLMLAEKDGSVRVVSTI